MSRSSPRRRVADGGRAGSERGAASGGFARDRTWDGHGYANGDGYTDDGDRGQTTIDYAVGVSVFLLTVAFVFGFLPSLVTPFTGDATDAVVVADRAADRLAGDLLVADPARPTVLDDTCTAGFFDADGAVPAGCRYDTDADDLPGALGIAAGTRSLNVTVRSVGSDGSLLYSAGPTPPRVADISVARRAVLLDGRDRSIVVRVW